MQRDSEMPGLIEHYLGSTRETGQTRAQKASPFKLAAVIDGSDLLDRELPTFRDESAVFL